MSDAKDERVVRERPILFSAPMVRALLAGAKTQTRRVVKLRGAEVMQDRMYLGQWPWSPEADDWLDCPYGERGDRLWVRETFHHCPHCGAGAAAYRAGGWICRPRVDGPDRDDNDKRPLNPKCAAHGWTPSIHMPRWASRITLDVTGVRVERLRAISETDALAEGVTVHVSPEEWQAVRTSDSGLGEMMWLEKQPSQALIDELGLRDVRHYPVRPTLTARQAYERLWESINGPDSWTANPWVWVVEFKRVTP